LTRWQHIFRTAVGELVVLL